MVKFEVGKIYKGLINNCLIKIIEIKPDGTAIFVDLKTTEKEFAPITRLEHSNFMEVENGSSI